jgi:hypothetical protein
MPETVEQLEKKLRGSRKLVDWYERRNVTLRLELTQATKRNELLQDELIKVKGR